MNVFAEIEGAVQAALDTLAREGVWNGEGPRERVTVEPPRDPSHGDMASNAAMVLAKPAGLKPRDLAEALAGKLNADARIVSAEIAGPGFLNLRLDPQLWLDALAAVLAAGTAFGDSAMGQGIRVNVEYISANPTGPMHAGHLRGAVFGDALASLLAKAGYDVIREYYINDAGAQVQLLARSAYLRYREALGEAIGEIPSGYYPGAYLKEVGAAIAEADGPAWLDRPEADWLPVFRARAVAMMMDGIRADLDHLGIRFDVFSSEAALVADGAVERALAELEGRGLIYTGVLEPPKGKTPEDWEPRPQLLFKATEWGDDVDRPLKKSDGSYTYFANDIAYHWDKARRGADILIDVMGADHGGYVKRMKAAVAALTDGKTELDIRICQLVKMLDNGAPVKLSKRAGNIVTSGHVIAAVGRDVIRFIMLTRRNDQGLDFDFAKVKEQSKDNPVFYVQYAHARCCSVLRHAADEVSAANLETADLSLLRAEEDLALIRQLAAWPRLVEQAAEAHEPHRVAFYLGELAAGFHGYWTKGREDATLRFLLPDDPALTAARLALVTGIKTVIASGLDVLGVTPVEEM